jgi:hypothetical protein
MHQEQPIRVVQQDQIDEFEDTAHAFFRTIFRKDADEVFITDLSDLSDFCHMRPPGAEPADTGKPYPQLVAEWDTWVLAEVAQHYQLTLPSTCVNLVSLFHRIEQQTQTRVLH